MKEKITLTVHGQDQTFSEQELIEILEKYFSNETINTAKVAKAPIEGEWFEVNPQAINQELFHNAREDIRQETTRQYILEAFEELKKTPQRYGRFKTMIPVRTWTSKTVEELKILAEHLGGHMANWVEQSLEWAQRIANGESWESICNTKDIISCSRLIIWKNGYARLVSVRCNGAYAAASCVGNIDYYLDDILKNSVPLVCA